MSIQGVGMMCMTLGHPITFWKEVVRSSYVRIRQDTSGYVRIRQHAGNLGHSITFWKEAVREPSLQLYAGADRPAININETNEASDGKESEYRTWH